MLCACAHSYVDAKSPKEDVYLLLDGHVFGMARVAI
jgi:hypothetical protein